MFNSLKKFFALFALFLLFALPVSESFAASPNTCSEAASAGPFESANQSWGGDVTLSNIVPKFGAEIARDATKFANHMMAKDQVLSMFYLLLFFVVVFGTLHLIAYRRSFHPDSQWDY